jgi:hypothetical protein
MRAATQSMKVALIYEELTHNGVECNLCAHRCLIPNGQNAEKAGFVSKPNQIVIMSINLRGILLKQRKPLEQIVRAASGLMSHAGSSPPLGPQ